MTARAAANRTRRAALGLAEAVSRGLAEGGRIALARAVRQSSGTVSVAILSRPVEAGGLGHPYGLGASGSKGPRGAIPNGGAAVVNAQSGAFRAAWSGSLSGFRFDVANSDSKAAWLLGGTAAMVARPFDVPIREAGAAAIPLAVNRHALALYKPFLP